MSLWEMIAGRSEGLLGKLYAVPNNDPKFGAASSMLLLQGEAVEDMTITPLNKEPLELKAGEEFVLAFTADDFVVSHARAVKNQDDVQAFLVDHSHRDEVD